MQLRIYRTFAWVNATPVSQMSFGGKPEYTLRATNTLQYLDEASGEWKALEVVEEPAPPHPDALKTQEFTRGIQELVASIACAEVLTPEKPEA